MTERPTHWSPSTDDPGILVVFTSGVTRVTHASMRFVPCPEWMLPDGTIIRNEAGHVTPYDWPGHVNRLLDHQPVDAGSEALVVPFGVDRGHGVHLAIPMLMDDLRAAGLTARLVDRPSPVLPAVQEPDATTRSDRAPGDPDMHELTVACPTGQLDAVLEFLDKTPDVVVTRQAPPLHANAHNREPSPSTPPAGPDDVTWLPSLRELRQAAQVPAPHTFRAGHHDLEVYCDGGASPNPGRGGAAIIWDDHGLGWSPDDLTDVTNNEMELIAAIGALRLCRALGGLPARLQVTADSQYVVSGITSWIHGWKRKGWRRSAGGPVENQRLWATLDAEREALEQAGVTVAFSWVRGHAGQHANERADRLATRARLSGHTSSE